MAHNSPALHTIQLPASPTAPRGRSTSWASPAEDEFNYRGRSRSPKLLNYLSSPPKANFLDLTRSPQSSDDENSPPAPIERNNYEAQQQYKVKKGSGIRLPSEPLKLF